MRVILISNQRKPKVVEALRTFRPWVAERAEIVADCDAYDDCPLDSPADAILVFGGDGTMLGIARRIVDLDVPMVGVNFGKLGFLAPFTLEDLKAMWEDLTAARLPMRQRVLIEATIRQNEADEPYFRSVAMNDCVITAGPPFRIIDLELTINPKRHGEPGTCFSGDGVLVATPTGSTAYNLSAGGPIIAPDVEAMVVTPICAYTLSFRPTVLSSDDRVTIRVQRANDGTTVVIDGQLSTPLRDGSVIEIAAYPKRLRVVANPRMGYWKTLSNKMHWARRPRLGSDD
jgi:NAD+ kinase